MDDRSEGRASTRRQYIGGTAAVLGGALAGCLNDDGSDSDGNDSTGDEPTEPGGNTDPTGNESTGDDGEEGSTGEGADDDESSDGASTYSVSMEPVGTVEFDSVPETWIANNGSWADMGIALGQAPPEAVWLTSRYHTQLYDEIPDLSVDKSDMTALWGSGSVDREVFHEFGADVHVLDPNFLVGRSDNWEQSDVDDIAENVAPFFGNSIFSGGYTWHEDYTYYTLYEAFEKLSQLFQETERYEAFATLHDEFQSNLEDVVPAEGDRPAVAIMWAGGNEPTSFSPYLISQGTSFKQWRDLGVRDALAETNVQDFHDSRGEIDFETLVKIDPEYLMFRGHENQTKSEFENTVVQYMEDHTLASQLTAVENGNVYRGGPLYQGPITNLVLTERAARQVYDVDTELFDRQRVADVVAGEF